MAEQFENWREIWSFESWEAVQEAAARALHDNGVNVPRENLLFERDTVSYLVSLAVWLVHDNLT